MDIIRTIFLYLFAGKFVVRSLALASLKRGEIPLCAGRPVRGKRTGRRSRPASFGM